MPKDFLCDRISEDSPLRFLDFDIGNYIHSKYRPSIPYLLEAVVFNDGQCRRAGNRKKVVKRTKENRHTAHWQRVKNCLVPTISWREFQLCMDAVLECVIAERFARLSYNAERWKHPLVSSNIVPSIEVDFGIGKQMVPMDGKLVVGNHDFMPQCIRHEKDKKLLKLRTSNYPLSRNIEMIDLVREKHSREMGHLAYYDYYKYDTLYNNLGEKRQTIFIRKAGVGSYWQLPQFQIDMLNEAMLFPRVPNIYQKKDDILEIIKLEYGLDDAKTKKLKNKYSVKQLVNIYWKELMDCF
tara:strand:- start:2291 stop:3178 length:888 start_codon:yes stop_codon:yes gene_type:complete